MIETTENYIREMVTPRARDAHKGSCGRVLLVCGSLGMAGAAVMSAKAALKSGAGLVTICAPVEIFPTLQTAVPEAMCVDREAIASNSIDLDPFDCIAVGPGLRVGHDQYRLVEHLLTSYRGPLVIDADGLNCLCRYGSAPERQTYMETEASVETDAMDIPRRMTSILPQITARRKSPVILTPHPGEADRLLDHLGQKKYRELGREKAAEVLAAETGAIVVLKGPGTLVAFAAKDGSADLFVNPTGNPGMATGGSGDVLTGVVAALVAYGQAGSGMVGGIPSGISPIDATRTAVYMHGLAGDIAASRIGEIGMTAMDIIDALPEVFRTC
ncbi:MAG: NAD(P)H-hydrate dehydratase [Firmicutes bacterium]|nr:NAD(P)H-hydrate dehydratase [Bacillota bacterium]